MIDTFKSVIDALSTPTVSFTLLTIFIPLVFPPTDWFDKINRKFGIWRLWTKPGLIGGMGFITFFFIVGYFDPNFNITLTKSLKPDTYDSVILATKHHQFEDMGASFIRSLCKPNHIIYDLKYTFKADESDLRL